MSISEKVLNTKTGILNAAIEVLKNEGYAGLSIRNVSKKAGVPFSQIQYHFGSKDGMVLALYEHMNSNLLIRQTEMFNNPELNFKEKWDLACDYLDTDIESGYVHVLQELMAVGWSNNDIGDAVRKGLNGWIELLTIQAENYIKTREAEMFFSANELAALIGAAFLGAESSILLGMEKHGVPYRKALRRFGELLNLLDQRPS